MDRACYAYGRDSFNVSLLGACMMIKITATNKESANVEEIASEIGWLLNTTYSYDVRTIFGKEKSHKSHAEARGNCLISISKEQRK